MAGAWGFSLVYVEAAETDAEERAKLSLSGGRSGLISSGTSVHSIFPPSGIFRARGRDKDAETRMDAGEFWVLVQEWTENSGCGIEGAIQVQFRSDLP